MTGLSAFGTILRMGRATDANTIAIGTDTLDLIAGITNISGPGLGLDTIDTTAHDSPGAFEEVIATIIRTGEVTLDLNYNPNNATHMADTTPVGGTGEGLAAALVNRSTKWFRLIFPTSPAVQWDFKGIVTAFEPDMPYDDKLGASVTIKLTGQPTLA